MTPFEGTVVVFSSISMVEIRPSCNVRQRVRVLTVRGKVKERTEEEEEAG